ncbi:transglycosylase SLT domain-containing protein [Shewanella amazonensis]|uniref:Soluble lytic murein transglycosylase, putative n=1 Tax=Shewanella amazonensis (strain ATCC BAA-1098 / SB2B) TaxID=326297 RepID=A1S6U4_SHEAM|nr:transglycosylase SLT domain-containing protein [Shewanella amazonensis]ABM00101.1 soluble lytic murein transglycosylase, putative [Shewanella amazonensis SB2B]
MLKQFYGICLTSLIFISPLVSADIKDDRQQFLKAEKALREGNKAQYAKLRKGLDDYPLAVYLDFDAQIDSLVMLPGSKAQTAIQAFQNTPFYGNARYRYLLTAAKGARWEDFLAISPDAPKDTALQCHYYQALLAVGDKSRANEGARRLWLNGSSMPDACDPLFTKWAKAGHRSQELIWSRMFLAFDAREASLLSYLAQKVTNYPKEAQKLLALYKDPRNLRHMDRYKAKAPVMAEMVELGLKALARKDLKEAVSLLGKYEKSGRFTKVQAQSLHAFMVRRVLLRQEESLLSYAEKHLPPLASDDLTELRLRWAIRDGDEKAIKQFLPLLSRETAAKERWQYWRLRYETSAGESDTLSAQLAADRSFYGFHAAQSQGMSPALNEVKASDVSASSDANLTQGADPALARVKELLVLERPRQARVEWLGLLGREDAAGKAKYGNWALENGLFALSVDASIQGKFWDDLGMRFPPAEEQSFARAAKRHKLNAEELRAIARRESAFNPIAQSAVGARGLMQLMPATAKQTAKKQGIKYSGEGSLYEPALNIQLGSAYYASLLERYNNNRVLATAAYNAGPSRVNAWLARSEGKLDVMAFIESIPFTETREYVQAVFSYRLIYEHRKGNTTPLFSEAELKFKY